MSPALASQSYEIAHLRTGPSDKNQVSYPKMVQPSCPASCITWLGGISNTSASNTGSLRNLHVAEVACCLEHCFDFSFDFQEGALLGDLKPINKM